MYLSKPKTTYKMKLRNVRNLSLVMIAGMLLTSCGGWSGRQEDALKKTLKTNFIKGFEKSGVPVDEALVDEWAQCVTDKAKEKFKSWDEFVENQSDPVVNQYMDECGSSTGLIPEDED